MIVPELVDIIASLHTLGRGKGHLESSAPLPGLLASWSPLIAIMLTLMHRAGFCAKADSPPTSQLSLQPAPCAAGTVATDIHGSAYQGTANSKDLRAVVDPDQTLLVPFGPIEWPSVTFILSDI